MRGEIPEPWKDERPASGLEALGGPQEPGGGQAGGAQQPGQSNPMGQMLPMEMGLSPNGSLMFGPGAFQDPTFRPRDEDMEYAEFQAREGMQAWGPQLRQIQQQVQQQNEQVLAEAEEKRRAWMEHHLKALAGGVVGEEDVISESIAPVREAFRPLGHDYAVDTLGQPIQNAIRMDIKDAGWDDRIELFEEVGNKNGVPVVRIPESRVTFLKSDGADPDEEDGEDRRFVRFDGMELPAGRRYAAMMGSPKAAWYRVWDLEEDADVPPSWATVFEEPIVLVKDEHGYYPVELARDEIREERTRPMWQGKSAEEAVDEDAGLGSAARTGVVSWLRTFSAGLIGSDRMSRRRDRQLSMIGSKGETRAQTIGTLAGFISPGGVPATAFKVGRSAGVKLAGKALAKRTESALARKITNFTAGATGAVVGGTTYEAFRPRTGYEEFIVDQMAQVRMSEDADATWDESVSEASADFARDHMLGSAGIFTMVETTMPALAKMGRLAARGARATGRGVRNVGRKVAGRKIGTLSRGAAARLDVSRARFDEIVGGGLAGAALGTEFALIDPATRQAFQKWWDSDFTDEEAWDQLVDGWVIGSSMFAMHGAVTSLRGYNARLKEHYEKFKETALEDMPDLVGLDGKPLESEHQLEAQIARIERRRKALVDRQFLLEGQIERNLGKAQAMENRRTLRLALQTRYLHRMGEHASERDTRLDKAAEEFIEESGAVRAAEAAREAAAALEANAKAQVEAAGRVAQAGQESARKAQRRRRETPEEAQRLFDLAAELSTSVEGKRVIREAADRHDARVEEVRDLVQMDAKEATAIMDRYASGKLLREIAVRHRVTAMDLRERLTQPEQVEADARKRLETLKETEDVLKREARREARPPEGVVITGERRPVPAGPEPRVKPKPVFTLDGEPFFAAEGRRPEMSDTGLNRVAAEAARRRERMKEIDRTLELDLTLRDRDRERLEEERENLFIDQEALMDRVGRSFGEEGRSAFERVVGRRRPGEEPPKETREETREPAPQEPRPEPAPPREERPRPVAAERPVEEAAGASERYAERHRNELERTGQSVREHLTDLYKRAGGEFESVGRMAEGDRVEAQKHKKSRLAEAANRFFDVPRAWTRERIEDALVERAKAYSTIERLGEQGRLDSMSRKELDALAEAAGFRGRSSMRKDVLAESLSSHVREMRRRQADELAVGAEQAEQAVRKRRSPEDTAKVLEERTVEPDDAQRERMSDWLETLTPGDVLQVGSREVTFAGKTGKTQALVRNEKGEETLLSESELFSGLVKPTGERRDLEPAEEVEPPKKRVVQRTVAEAAEEIEAKIPEKPKTYKEGIRTNAERRDFEDMIFEDMKGREEEVVGVVGYDSIGTPVAVRVADGNPRQVITTIESIENKAASAGVSEIVGVYHTHPKGQDVSMADRNAARHILDRLGLKLYVHDGKGLFEIGPSEGRTDGTIESSEVLLKDMVREVDDLVDAIKEVKKKVKKGKASEEEQAELEGELESAKNNLLKAENALGEAKEDNPYKKTTERGFEAEGEAGDTIIMEAATDAPGVVGGSLKGEGATAAKNFTAWLRRWMPKGSLRGEVLNPSYRTMSRAYDEYTTHTPRGITGLFRSSRQFIPPTVYRAMRDAHNELATIFDRMQRVAYGRSPVDRIKYGGRGVGSAPLSKNQRESSSAFRISLALDGGRVKDWNATEVAVKKGGRIEADENMDMRDVLNERERAAYDALDPLFQRMRRRLWEHIKRHDFSQTKDAIAKRKEEFVKAERFLAEARVHPDERVRPMLVGKGEKRLERAKGRLQEKEHRLEMLQDLRDPDTGKRWGFERYFHHLHESKGDTPGAGWHQLDPITREEIPLKRWVSMLERRTGRDGWSLDLHKVLDVYIPQAFRKIMHDRMLEKADKEIYGATRKARGVEDLHRTWHAFNRKIRSDMAIKLETPEGDTHRFASLPGTARFHEVNGKSVLRSIVLRNIGTGETMRVFGRRQWAREDGMAEARLASEFLVRDGGLAQEWEKPEVISQRIDYIERTINRSLGRRPDYGKVMKWVDRIARTLTAYEYHAYIGMLYPKAAATNMIFGSVQLVAEVGLPDAARGMEMALEILVRGRGNSSRRTRHYWKALRKSGTHLETFVGYDAESVGGISPPVGMWSKTKHGAHVTSFFMFKNSERLVRAASYLAGYIKAERAGASPAEAQKFAEEVVANTQFDMGGYAAPDIVNRHPLGYPLIMLRRYAINYAERHIRGYAGLGHLAHAQQARARLRLAEKTGYDPVKALKSFGRDGGLDAVERDHLERTAKKGDRSEHIHNGAFAIRSAIWGAIAITMYRELFGRDPRVQIASTLSEMPFLEKAHFLHTQSDLGRFFMNVPIPGFTGPYDPTPLPAKTAGAVIGGVVDKMNGDHHAMRDAFEKNMDGVIGRMPADLWNIVTAEADENEKGGRVVRRGGRAHYRTTTGEMWADMFIPGTPIDRREEWEDWDEIKHEDAVRKNLRSSFNRLIVSDDPEDVDKAMEIGLEHHLMKDPGDLGRMMAMKEAPANVRRILTGSDKTSQVAIAAKMMKHYNREDGTLALWVLGAVEPGWHRNPNGTLKVKPEVLQDFSEALAAWHERTRPAEAADQR